MSRILKRPMFKTGGTPNEGIMHGLVDRRGYKTAGFVLDEGQLGTDIEAMTSAMNKYAPLPKSKFPMGQIGINLVSSKYAGDGLLSNIARSAEIPYSEWTKADDAREQAMAGRKGSAVTTAIGQQYAQELARRKAAGQSGFLKKETTEGAYEHFLEENLKAASELKGYQKPNLQQKYPRQVAEFDSYVSRDLRSTASPQGKEIAANFVDFVPFDVKNQTFDYDKMMPGMYYYEPRDRTFVQRVPDDPNTPEDEGGIFKYDKTTFTKTKLPGRTE